MSNQSRIQACHPPSPQTLVRSFSFCTGIENSAPIIAGPDGQPCRIDQMTASGHRRRWREDFRLVHELGIRCLRFGPPYYATHMGPGLYDWTFADETLTELSRLDITPIVDLCHFGLPDWLGNFQNPDFPRYFAEYAEAFARRYPWVWMYTPVNEMLVTAEYSALRGYWNERLSSDRAFVNALGNVVEANIRASEAICRVCSPWFVQSEATRYYHPSNPDAVASADYLNERRFLPLDLNYGHMPSAQMLDYLFANGMSRARLDYFMQRSIWPSCVMGTDYYEESELVVFPDGTTRGSNVLGYYGLTRQYHDRYRLPIMHTETNQVEKRNAVFWLERQWANVLRLRQEGYPIIGFTWYSLTDQVDWDIDLRELRGHVVENGLFDMGRQIRRAGEEYRRIIRDWSDVLAGGLQPECGPETLPPQIAASGKETGIRLLQHPADHP
ncbi:MULTISPECIES: family 1 glycosylhydrolase [unclassified Massilia]|uniref:family 1 glycosylhydrolase n=1 Tax=unclassified Massilia TaxID=2609279 RepID=UPI000A4F192A|nr:MULTISPECIES: family 1 glycosylhydrolase [unclassified Massilia]